MSQPATIFQSSPSAAGNSQNMGARSTQPIDNVVCSLIEHARPTAEEISELASDRKGFGLALTLLGFIRMGRSLLPLACLDLSGPHVCQKACLPVLLGFLRTKAGGTGETSPISLKILNLSNCDLGEAAVAIFHHLPRCLENLDVSGNRLRSVSVRGLGSAFSFGWIPSVLCLDLSDNPICPSGMKALSRGLSSSPQSLPLQSLKLARTKAKAEGVEALAEALKAKKTTSLQTLDLAENDMRPAGLKHLASAVNAEAVPQLRVLILKDNLLAYEASGERDCCSAAELLSTSSLKDLEELDLSGNLLFDREIGGAGTGSQLSAAAFAVPGRFPKLRRLDLGPRRMSSVQLAALATALSAGGAPSLQELVLPDGGSYENPNPEGVVALTSALSSGHLSQLRGLKVRHWDDMTGEAFGGLCRSLATGKASLLQTLDFEMSNDDAAEGVVALAEGIQGQGLSSLESFRLKLSDVNGFAVSGLGLAFGCGGCAGLQKLDLAWEEEGDEGVGGLAEGLGGGRLPSLRDLSLEVTCRRREGEGEWGGEGCIALGEVLSRGKVPSLRTVSLDWECNHSFRSLCEGLARGKIDPPVMVDIHLVGGVQDADMGVMRFAEVIRAGKMSGLRHVKFAAYQLLSPRVLGEALTHADASLNSLEEAHLLYVSDAVMSAFFEGLSRGPGSLPALHTLNCSLAGSLRAQGSQSLSALVSRGRVPALRDLSLNLWGIGQEGIQPFAASLNSPTFLHFEKFSYTSVRSPQQTLLLKWGCSLLR
uniref:Uncharacterized protein n=1 Tax=Chromera velia CCMP2878 TaxID=1169474 RepID=A0A0G4FNV4_9ALVE|eukprot:Cvel_17989.t1-p1 / transcript=Cvel_17989.t1 / gene=Cvel_17989 / organism=Chromera_velia_CCMP2878 / gene_product=hypothetical protein / transcript_product=hypothetical protein / location=Cvel_scaffold1466:1513-5539(-) / protein_length=764 / sequence_SO=supercontig / SO=protein_coding / is_pseudo=false